MLKFFGSAKKQDLSQKIRERIGELVTELLEGGEFSLSFQLEEEEDRSFKLDIFGEDEGLLKARKGKFLLALQTYLLQVLYKEFQGEKLHVLIDSNGFWKEKEERLLALTDHLVQKALDSGRPVVFKHSLSPSQRKLVHERVGETKGIKSLSFGPGPYKNMKLLPDSFENKSP